MERNFKRFGIQNWIDHGWKVKVFDITKFKSPEFWRNIDGKKISHNYEGLTFFNNINELLFAINNLQNKVIFIDLLDFSYVTIKIRKAARANGIIVKLRLGYIPKGSGEKKFLELLKLVTNPINFVIKLISFIKTKISHINAKNFNPDYLVVGGTKSLANIDEKKTSIIRAHNFDYDYFIEGERVELNKNSNFLVFLDEDAAYHSDYKKLKVKPFVKADNYYPIVDNGLNKIAKSLNLNIKIAAHPRSNYETKSVKFNFPTIKNNTFELIKDSDVVVGHSSTAIQYALLLKKPIILVTTDEIQKAPYAKHWKQLINSLALTLGKEVINLNNLSNLNNYENYLNIDHKKYDLYIENYIKIKGSPEKKLWNIIIEHIQKDLSL